MQHQKLLGHPGEWLLKWGRLLLQKEFILVGNLAIPPFGSIHLTGLSRSKRLAFDVAFGLCKVSALPRLGRRDDGRATRVSLYARQALDIDSTYAGAHYFRANGLAMLGRSSGAIGHYLQAIDYDAVPHRAKSKTVDVIREVARGTGAVFVDLQPAFAEHSPNGIWGPNLFVDHVHFNERGHALVAKVLCEQIAEQGWLK